MGTVEMEVHTTENRKDETETSMDTTEKTHSEIVTTNPGMQCTNWLNGIVYISLYTLNDSHMH